MTDRQQLIVNNVDTAKQLILDAEHLCIRSILQIFCMRAAVSS